MTVVLITIICSENVIFFNAKLTLKFRVRDQLTPSNVLQYGTNRQLLIIMTLGGPNSERVAEVVPNWMGGEKFVMMTLLTPLENCSQLIK